MNKLLALADRVEKLTGPDREVDAEIALTCGIVRERDGNCFYGHKDYSSLVLERDYYDIEGSAPELPAYTASIGPAMSLLPDEWDHMEVYRPDYQALGWTVHVMYNANIDRAQIKGFAQSHELALVAASLRARAHGGGEG